MEAGTYTVTISGYPADASFDATSAEVTIASSGQTVTRNFSGSYIRTASLMGMVTVEGQGLPGIKVAISGRQSAETTTDVNGQYAFTGLRAGNYTIEISNFDPTDVAFSNASGAVTVAVGESRVHSFDGTYVRESTIMGRVSVAGSGLADVTVSLQGMGADEEIMTDDGGQYTFDNLRAGEYQLAISGFDSEEYGFTGENGSTTTRATIRVEHGKTANVPFEGILLRTASIMGQVSVEGKGLPEVTVSLQGEGENQTTMTDNSGQYTFSDLPAGNFQVGISGYDTDDYSFETTSRNVSLALGKTATVPFEGILLRTSGISGRVSVEGMSLDTVTVTLSGDDLEDDLTTMTDASGQYAFAGLAEGEYTVAISGYDDVAYIFKTTIDVTLGDDDVQIHNFMGMHARTAMVSGMIYLDEAGKNNAYDEGEDALAQAGIALALVGPGINDVVPGVTGPDGSFAFTGLRSGPYQLVVSPTNPAIPAHHAYGGPTEGYPIKLDVGQAVTQNIPFDITHTTVNFSVKLKSGAAMGDSLPGATVSFFRDMAGTVKIGEEKSGDNGIASMPIERIPGSHIVYASVAAPKGDYRTDGMRQPVMWDPKLTTHAASNSSDIVNTKADFSFSGATIKTEFAGSGKALAGWAISVTSGGKAVTGAPVALGADGSAKFSETADAGKTYKVKIAANQADSLDGGEKYKADSVMYTHTGLELPATMPTDKMTVTYTTQTLKVYVHNERDQVRGYTGNVLDGDKRTSGMLDISIRYIERSTGRSRAFPTTPASARIRENLGKANAGVYVFSNVPASAQVIVRADTIAGKNVMLLGDDELDAYTNNADGLMKGAFGDEGGFNHTVELCPLMSRAGDQRHGECGTFAYVNTYHVHGQVWENTVATDGNAGGFKAVARTAYKGVVVSMTWVPGENLAGNSPEPYTSGTDIKATRNFNEATQFDWKRLAAGEYKLNVSRGWVAKVGAPGTAVAFGDQLSPLGADLQIDVTPTTGYVYGTVKDSKGFRVDSAAVSANGSKPVMTDAFGRYRIRDFSGATINKVPNRVAITVTKEGFTQGKATVAFAANAPHQQDFDLSGEAATATVSGTVRASGSGDPIGGVTIKVNGGRPLGRTTDLKTDAKTGTYIATVPVGSVTIAPSKAGMSFFPESHTTTTTDGGGVSGLDFTGYAHGKITGRVLNTSGGPMSGAKVTATPAGGGAVADSARTDVRGVYGLSVPFGRYTVAVDPDDGHTFATEDGNTSVSVNVASGATESVEDFEASVIPRTPSSVSTLSGLSLGDDVDLEEDFDADTEEYTADAANNVGSVTVTGTATDEHASVSITLDADDEDADQSNGRSIDLAVGENPVITVMVVSEDESNTTSYEVTVTRAQAVVTLSGPETVDEGGEATITASVDHAQESEFTVEVDVDGGAVKTGTADTLVFAAGATDATGSVTIVADNDTIRSATAKKVTVEGDTDNDDVADIEDLEITVTDDEIVASAPRNLRVTATEGGSSGDVTLTWDKPGQIGTWEITGYEAEATATARASVTGTVTDLTAAFTGLALGVEYTFTVHATTAGGDGDEASKTGKALPTVNLANAAGGTTPTILEKKDDTTGDSIYVVASLNEASAEDVVVTVTSRDTDLATVGDGGMITITAGKLTSSDSVLVKAVNNPRDAAPSTDTTVLVVPVAPNANAGDSITVTITDDDTKPSAAPVLTVTGEKGSLLLTWTFDATAWGNAEADTRKFQYRVKNNASGNATFGTSDKWVDVPGDDAARSIRVTVAAAAYIVELRATTEAGSNDTAATGTGTAS